MVIKYSAKKVNVIKIKLNVVIINAEQVYT